MHIAETGNACGLCSILHCSNEILWRSEVIAPNFEKSAFSNLKKSPLAKNQCRFI